MTFTESIKTCFVKYADFTGRASRSEYWYFVLLLVLVSLGTSLVNQTLSLLFSLLTLVPSISAAARRLHDTDRSGWMQLIALVPVIGWVFIIYFLAQEPKEPNRFGLESAPADPVSG
jgi:uncharacterized membrane protein YhaH (DUF805 family)